MFQSLTILTENERLSKLSLTILPRNGSSSTYNTFILDIILFAQKRIERGEFVTRVIFESFIHIDDYLFFLNDFGEVSLI